MGPVLIPIFVNSSTLCASSLFPHPWKGCAPYFPLVESIINFSLCDVLLTARQLLAGYCPLFSARGSGSSGFFFFLLFG